MEKIKVLLCGFVLLLFFSFGFIASQFYNSYKDNYPVSLSPNSVGIFVEITPSDYLTKDNIFVYDDRIEIKINNSGLSSYDRSGSMTPVLDGNANGIVIVPRVEEDIDVGDIVSFLKNGEIIVHRVVGKGTDEGGIYFITKGDNSDEIDEKVRFFEIRHKLVGILY